MTEQTNKEKLEKNVGDKNVTVGDIRKENHKKWSLKTLSGEVMDFYPYFEQNLQNDIECKKITIRGEAVDISFNYLDLLMFLMAVGNEEQQRKLMNYQLRTVRELPYDVYFKLDKVEREKGIVKRRIVLKVDEVLAAYCQHEAVKFNLRKQQRSSVAYR